MFSNEQIEQLTAPLLKSAVKTREQGGRDVAYIEGWHAIAEANRIFGFGFWTRELVRLEETNRELLTIKRSGSEYQQWRVGYLAVVRVTANGIVREGTGFGSGSSKPEALGDAIESAIKEAETDAMKRALMTFGNPFGLALYDKEQKNVEQPPSRAEAYISLAVEAMKTKATEDDLRAWWKAEAMARRANGLSQDQVDGLMEKLKARAAEVIKEEEHA